MRPSAYAFAACLALGLPCAVLAVGADLPGKQLAALALLGFALGLLIPAGLDFLFGDGADEDKSLRRQRDAGSAMTEALAAKVLAELPGPVAAVAEVEPVSNLAHDHAWKTAMLRGIYYAEIFDWPFEVLGPEGVNVMDRGDWDKVTDHLRDCAVLHKREKSRTRYQSDYTPARAREVVNAGLALPYPPGPAPVVHDMRCTVAQETVITQKLQARKGKREGEAEPGPSRAVVDAR